MHVLNGLLLVHFGLALAFGVFAIVEPHLLIQLGTLNPSAPLLYTGIIYGRLFGVTLIGIASLLLLARLSPSTPAREIAIVAIVVHLITGVGVSLLLLPSPTRWIALLFFIVLLLVYGIVWIFRRYEV